jgi:glycosyltransferase involved in cell wall biosynthesis
VGFVDRAEVASRQQQSALSIIPLQKNIQLDYARPNKLLVSTAVGTACVASDILEIQRVINESGGGLVVSNDPDEIATAIQEHMSDTVRREKMGTSAVTHIDTHHRWSLLGERVTTVLDTVS